MMVMMSTIRDHRRAYRDPGDRFVAGVASGLAVHLGLPTSRVRFGFLVLTLLGGFGAVLYAGLWLMLPVMSSSRLGPAYPPGVGSATRRGLRTQSRAEQAPHSLPESGQESHSQAAVAFSVLVCFLGVVALLQGLGLGLSTRVFWPLLVGSGGVVLLWWQSDESQRYAWLSTSASWKVLLRTIAGVVTLVVAGWLAIFSLGVRGALGTAIATFALALVGGALVIGPWLLRTNRALRYERTERVRTQERADVAAHLHDSVLQTLAVIQRQSGDPQTVVHLARTQERELRRWLFEPVDDARQLLGAALRDAAAEVEEAHGLPIEVVMVGDVVVADRYAPLVAATREALLNAAKHSGAERVDVYGEVGPEAVEIFVRDRGRGFDRTRVSSDRLGVTGSIADRMSRHGGSSDVRSGLGEGTEVRLRMPADPASAVGTVQRKAP